MSQTARPLTTHLCQHTDVGGCNNGHPYPQGNSRSAALPDAINAYPGSNDVPTTTGPHGAGANDAGRQGTPTMPGQRPLRLTIIPGGPRRS